MTQILHGPGRTLVPPGRLLVVAMVPLVGFMVMAHTTVVGGSAGEMTSSQVDERALRWMVVAVLWVLPVVLAALAFAALAPGRLVRVLTGVGIVLLIGYVGAQAGVVWLDDARVLADSSWLALAMLLSLLGWWAIDIAAVCTCLHLYRTRVVPRTALVIGILTGVLTLLEVAIYLPALVGPRELHETVGLPPMLLPVLWAVLGGMLWRRRESVSR